MFIDHTGFSVSDYQRSKTFYLQALKPLRAELIMEVDEWGGFGRDSKPQFWVGKGDEPHAPLHIAFVAENREQVRQFYQAALEAGGKDNGGPGLRENYHPNYYAAFIIDPDGHNIEALCLSPE